jgi:hypothetical protein
MDYDEHPAVLAREIVRLGRRIETANVPDKVTDRNLLIATWNIQAFGRLHPSYAENPPSSFLTDQTRPWPTPWGLT